MLDTSSELFQMNRYALLAQLQAQTALYYREREGDWLILRHADVKRLFSDHQRLRSSNPGRSLQRPAPNASDSALAHLSRSALGIQELWLPQRDPPDHTRIRRVVQPLYDARLVHRAQAYTAEVADELLDKMVEDNPESVDLIPAFIAPLMQRFIGYLFDTPPEWTAQLGGWSQDILSFLELEQDDPVYQRGYQAFNRFLFYFASRFQERCPTTPILDRLRDAHHQARLTEEELTAQSVLLYVAGHTTTQDLIGNALYQILQDHPLQDRLKRDPSRISDLVQETLRYEPPGQYFVRWAHEDMDLLGQRISAGQRILLMVAAANRDPRVFENPHQFDMDRAPNHHLSFGHGIHHCVGALLAPRIAQTAIEKLLARVPQLYPCAGSPPQWKTTFMFRGLHSLPVCYA